MIMEERAIDRLRKFIAFLKEKKMVKGEVAFESSCGLSNKYISNASKGKGTIGSDILSRISAKYPELNIKWICSGEGDMITIDNGMNICYKKAYDGAMMQVEALREILRIREGKTMF